MPNHLINEKSPYLLQHAHNPVDWYPWGETALKKAKEEEKPIFLSIGYATCHWCHVMAHESFEAPEVAAFLNRHFVPIKVDREERPDLDAVYMAACQALTGHGGWPLSVFLTPEGKPFYAGTYFPKEGRFGMTGFLDLLAKIAELWENQRGKIFEAGEQTTSLLEKMSENTTGVDTLSEETLRQAYDQLRQTYDASHGGFGAAPKFPTPHHLTFLLRWYERAKSPEALTMAEETLMAMRRGGIFDHVGFGFHRYSVDTQWHVPHFEKMLYDQAMLMMAYAEAFQVTRNPRYAATVREIFDYLQRVMTHPEGGFYSAEDADSEGKEGLFYLWTPRQVKEILGRETGELICRYFDITEEGNFEGGRSIPRILVSFRQLCQQEGLKVKEWEKILGDSRRRLLAVREKRVHPLKDDKILTSWNGLMIAALALAAKALGEIVLLDAAKNAETFIRKTLWTGESLYHRYRDGDVAIEGFLEDNAFLAWGLLELYEASLDVEYLERAVALHQKMMSEFWDTEKGGFFFTRSGASSVLTRRKDLYDGAIPSANSVVLSNLVRLGHITGGLEYHRTAQEMINYFATKVSSFPMGYTHFLNGLSHALGPSREIVIVGKRDNPALSDAIGKIHAAFTPRDVLVFYDPGDEAAARLCPYLSSYPHPKGDFDIYVCENGTCRSPVPDIESLDHILGTDGSGVESIPR
ncbi:MAG: thioredoxin domain-containing protein [Deltaproteobacteria bacterium]|nr:thioredoxin domain-containing protein [Deltaproteobacteria bacterium]